MNIPQGKRGVAYVRVSHGEEQDPQRQRDAVLRWASRLGLTIQRWYEDIEGRNPRDLAEKRPAFRRLLADVESSKVDWVVTESQDRFGVADNYEFGYYAHILRIHDCHLWTVGQGCLTGGDDAAVFTSTIGNVTSTREQKEKGRRVIGGKQARIKRGEWQGGYVPFGYDVACVDAQDKELWRVVILKMVPVKGIWHRLKITPEGKKEQFDGHNVFPAKERGQRFVLTPTIIPERVEMAKKIFEWFATGTYTLRGLCTHLNRLGVEPVYNEQWYQTRLRPLLQNPVYYTGATVWNKKSHGRHMHFSGGETVPVKRTKGKTKSRTNKQEDWTYPEKTSQAILDKALWDKVQELLAAMKAKTKPRGLRCPDLWLAGLMYCGHCGKKMAGWNHHDYGPSYTCTTYRTLGKGNKEGCRLHLTPQSQIEPIVKEYFQGIQPQIAALLGEKPCEIEVKGLAYKVLTINNPDPGAVSQTLAGEGLPKPLIQVESERLGVAVQASDILFRMLTFIKDRTGDPRKVMAWWKTLEEKSLDEGVGAVCQEYLNCWKQQQKGAVERLTAKRQELDDLVARMAMIPRSATTALEMAGQKIAALDNEVQQLERETRPLTLEMDGLMARLTALGEQVGTVLEAIASENPRQKAEGVRSFVGRILCFYEPVKRGQHDGSRLVNVKIKPADVFQSDNQPVQG